MSSTVIKSHALFILGLLPSLSVDVETAVHDMQPLPVNGEIPAPDADEESAIKDDGILDGPTVLAHVDLARTPRKLTFIDCFRNAANEKITRTKACKKSSRPR